MAQQTVRINAATGPATLIDEDQRLLEAFNSKFGLGATDPAVVKRMLGSPHVKGWYADYRAQTALGKALPEHWAAIGATPEEWYASQAALQSRRKVRSTLSQKAADLSARFQKDLQTAEDAASAELAATTTPLIRVFESGYSDLPIDRQFTVESAHVDQRDQVLEAQLKAFRIEALAEVRKGNNPFRA
jgi:hypothetical protein